MHGCGMMTLPEKLFVYTFEKRKNENLYSPTIEVK